MPRSVFSRWFRARRSRRRIDAVNPAAIESLEAKQLLSAANPSLDYFIADVNTNETLVQVEDGDRVDPALVEGRLITIYALADDDASEAEINSVRLRAEDVPKSRLENAAPYALSGDRRGDFHSRNGFTAQAGDFNLRGIAYSERRGNGDVLLDETFTFEFASDEAPVLGNDFISLVEGDETQIFDVLANDSDSNGDDFTVEILSGPSQGTAEFIDGQLHFTPEIDAIGSDSLTYLATDSRGFVSEPATVSIDIADDPTRFVVTNLPQEILDANPGLQSAIADDGINDADAFQAIVDFVTPEVKNIPGECNNNVGVDLDATIVVPGGTFEFAENVLIEASIDLVGAGAGQSTITNLPSFEVSAVDIDDPGDDARRVNKDGYLFALDKTADDITVSDITFSGPGVYGAIFGFDADGLVVRDNDFNSFKWSGLRLFSGDDVLIENNTFIDAGGQKLKANGAFEEVIDGEERVDAGEDADAALGSTGGGVYATFMNDTTINNNHFERTSGRRANFYGVKGRKFVDSTISNNTILTNFAIELPFENDEGNVIRNNYLDGVVSLPKFAGGKDLDDAETGAETGELAFDIRNNYFTRSYSLEWPRNDVRVANNVFEFDIRNDGGNLITSFEGEGSAPGDTEFHNNLIVNPGRGILAAREYNNFSFTNNLVIGNRGVSSREEAMFNFDDDVDFETIDIRDNVFELYYQERPLFSDEAEAASNVVNNTLIGISDTDRYTNEQQPGVTQGLIEDLLFSVGVDGGFLVDGDAIAEAARNQEAPGFFDTDGDGVVDNVDPAMFDASNGLNNVLLPGQTIGLEFDQPNNETVEDPSIGLTALSVNRQATNSFYAVDPRGVLTSDDLARISDGMLRIKSSPTQAFQGQNNATDDYGFMINTSQADRFTIESLVSSTDDRFSDKPFPQLGIQISDGSQQSYVKFIRGYGSNQHQLEVTFETEDSRVLTRTFALDEAQSATTVYRLSLDVDRSVPTRLLVTPRAQAFDRDGNEVGNEIVMQQFIVRGDIRDAANGLNNTTGGTGGLFAGVVSSHFSSANNSQNRPQQFEANFEYLRVTSGDVVFDNDPFRGVDVSAAGRQIASQPVAISSFESNSLFRFSRSDFGLLNIFRFASGTADEIQAAGQVRRNAIVLLGEYSSVTDAADAITSTGIGNDGPGVFSYFDSTLGHARLVYSANLNSTSSDLSILASLLSFNTSDSLVDLDEGSFQFFD